MVVHGGKSEEKTESINTVNGNDSFAGSGDGRYGCYGFRVRYGSVRVSVYFMRFFFLAGAEVNMDTVNGWKNMYN